MQLIKKIGLKLEKIKYFFLYFFIFFIPRFIGLGKDVYGIDAYLWDMRSDKFVEAVLTGNFIETNQKYHPGVTVMWLSGFSKKLYRILFEMKRGYSPMIEKGVVYPEQFFQNLFVASFPLVIVISSVLALTVFLLYKIGVNKKLLLFFTILLSLEPFFLGISRFFHLTGLEATFGFAIIVTGYYYTKNSKFWVILLMSLYFALGFLTKTSMMVFMPFFGLVMFAGFFVEKKDFTNAFIKSISAFVQTLVIGVILIFLFWPALWVAPFYIVQDVYRSGIRDRAFVDNPSPSLTHNKYLYYYEMFFLRSTALILIGYIGSTVILVFNKVKTNKFLLTMSVLFVPYYAFVMALPSKQIDRYAAVLFPFAVLAASFFYHYIYTKLKKRSFKIAYISILVLYLFTIQWVYYPNYSSPISELFGGPWGYSHFDKMKNRGEFYLQVTEYLNKKDGHEAYNKALVVPHGGKDLSAKGYLGSVYTDDGLIPGGKQKADYYAPDYLDLKEIPTNRDCKRIKSFGYRWPLKFDYVFIYECK